MKSQNALKESRFRFQSLFLWMCFLNRSNVIDNSTNVRVSILVFVDVLLESSTHTREREKYMFQSLFLWMCFLNLQKSCILSTLFFQFQSLFLWMCFLNFMRKCYPRQQNEFQSLFLWMCFLNFQFGFCQVIHLGFQSLFLWMCFLNETWRRTGGEYSCRFNPCFCGCAL